MPDEIEPTEEEVQARLAGLSVAGPRMFQGRPLAKYSLGLKDLHLKVMRSQDSDLFYFFALVNLLGEAYGADHETRAQKRDRLLAATDATTAYRGNLSLLLDELTEEEAKEAMRLGNEIAEEERLARTAVVPDAKKKEGDALVAESTPTAPLSTSSTSPESSQAEIPTGSSGN